MTEDDVPLWRLYLLRSFYLLTPLVLPWRYIAHNYLPNPGQRWC